MKNKPYKAMVYIGRFEPPTIAHNAIFQKAAELSDQPIILVGSGYRARDPRIPFTHEERSGIINNIMLDFVESPTIRVIRDHLYNNSAWITQVQNIVNCAISTPAADPRPIGIIGHDKDHTSWYLKEFPQWSPVDAPYTPNVDATKIRNLYFLRKQWAGVDRRIRAMCPPQTFDFLQEFRNTDTYNLLVEETECIRKYKKSWAKSPYTPAFLTADSLVVQSGHILLVQRRASPGKGLYALPGGFVNPTERIFAASIRELREETRLKVPPAVLEGSLSKTTPMRVFDHPQRSLRGRTVTQVYKYELASGPLPKVKGGDDAQKAVWVPLSELRSLERKMFEDHYHMINCMMGFDSIDYDPRG